MCRWLAYSGPPILLSSILIKPNHSLIDQSIRARENGDPTNGDGFGLGWYGKDAYPGLYHSTHPAWNDVNLAHLSRHIQSGMFMAHVRSATGTPVQESNCHPFGYEEWLFQHNGTVPEFQTIKRQLLFEVDEKLFPFISGSTDSEILFFLALFYGLKTDPKKAFERVLGFVESFRKRLAIIEPLTFSISASNGSSLYAVRYSSDNSSPTLYHSRHLHALRDIKGFYDLLPNHAAIVLSEPLDNLASHWQKVEESSFLDIKDDKTVITKFTPS